MSDTAAPAEERLGGIITRVFPKGYGFILQDDGKTSVYFHATDVQTGPFDELLSGTKVTFEVMEDPRGVRAVKVQEVGKELMERVKRGDRGAKPEGRGKRDKGRVLRGGAKR